MSTLLIHNAHTVATQNDQGDELRETSVLFATVLGTLMLKERFGAQRALGAAVIVAGVMALRLG